MAFVMVGIEMVATLAMPGDLSKVTMVSINEFRNMLNNPDLSIIDVRYEKDWEKSDMKIKGPVREDYMRVETWADKYPKGKFIVLYCACPDERTSARVARELLDRGFTNVRVLKGGWNAWVKAGYPMVKK
jgi:rhodanese-related sulfurtransferase